MDFPMDQPTSDRFVQYPTRPYDFKPYRSTKTSSATVSPAMEYTGSSDGSVYAESSYGSSNTSYFPFPAPPMTMNSIPMNDMDWVAPDLSFSEHENTPSLSSSYEFVDVQKNKPHTWETGSYYALQTQPASQFQTQTTSASVSQTQIPFMPMANEANISFHEPSIHLDLRLQEPSTQWTWPTLEENWTQPSPAFPDSSTLWQRPIDHPISQGYKISQPAPILPKQPMMYFQSAQTSAMYGEPHIPPPMQALPLHQEQVHRTTPALIPSTFSPITPHPEQINPSNQRLGPGSKHAHHQIPLQQHTPQSLCHPDSPPMIQNTSPRQLQATLHYSDTRDRLLVEGRRAGLTYKAIKETGNFKEAESTLRGRYRALTKVKEQRVRKPKWLRMDIDLLVEAVSVYRDDSREAGDDADGSHDQGQNGGPPKVPWKKVAQYIWANGGSYQFGNATCKKKWCEIFGVAM
ncbi:hypothetical protein N7466_003118 [Penicillium verhagenii]|uniref:uncharacterized protein n=1 Tax=Penicillium verhagenii TaxID=1562060 RepID=UPI0025451932|nr:uncharacterized protein N7466_003118 [Penicillium verhagenii]KAJ5936668.1 hypothetical protein N7466_003118 [Penicillium verhagenii]